MAISIDVGRRVSLARVAFLSAWALATVACGGTATSQPSGDESGGSSAQGTGAASSGSGGSGSNTSSNSGGGGGQIALETPCTNPSLPDEGGVIQCAEGYTHRPMTGQCSSALPRDQPLVPSYPQGVDTSGCLRDDDCAGAYGYCALEGNIETALHTVCRQGCVSDDQCGEGQLCRCGDPVGRCVSAGCRTDDDCGADKLCVGRANSDGSCWGYSEVFACVAPGDECILDTDCPNFRCVYSSSGSQCSPTGSHCY